MADNKETLSIPEVKKIARGVADILNNEGPHIEPKGVNSDLKNAQKQCHEEGLVGKSIFKTLDGAISKEGAAAYESTLCSAINHKIIVNKTHR